MRIYAVFYDCQVENADMVGKMNVLLRLRKHLGMTQAEFASVIGVSGNARVSQLENAKYGAKWEYVRRVIVYMRERGPQMTLPDWLWEGNING
jgi:DNA-binding XRE family transcriptional regulator